MTSREARLFIRQMDSWLAMVNAWDSEIKKKIEDDNLVLGDETLPGACMGLRVKIKACQGLAKQIDDFFKIH